MRVREIQLINRPNNASDRRWAAMQAQRKTDERNLMKALQATSAPLARDVALGLGITHKQAGLILYQWSTNGWYDWGVSIMSGWLTDEGKLVKREDV